MGISEAELRKRWWNRYLRVQGKADIQIRTILVQGAQDAQERVSALEKNYTFSAGVRTAQLHLAMQEIKKAHHDIFGSIAPVIKTGHRNAASAAMEGLSETDRRHLRLAVFNEHDYESYLKSAKQTALNEVTAAIQRVQKTDIPLSSRVYRSESLANRWVQRIVTSGIMRGDSAKEIAKAVKSHILPSVPGGTSYAALRLGRTELNNAFHATAIEASQDRPWITGMRWHVSATHIDDPNNNEACDLLKNKVFPMDKVPGKPHPQCRCFVTPEIISIELFKERFEKGQYNDWIKNAA